MLFELDIRREGALLLSLYAGSALLCHNKKVKLAEGQPLLVAGIGTAHQI